MEIKEPFKNKNKEEKTGVTDFISRIVQVLKRELVQLRNSVQELDISIQEAGLIKQVEL